MSYEFFEICHESLAGLLKEKDLSQAELAHRLRMSKKTVQRWINRSTRRITSETLHQLAQALNAPHERLVRSPEKLQVRPVNMGLKELTSESYLAQVRMTDQWVSYLKILQSFPPEEIPSQQQIDLFKAIGISNIYLGKLRASKSYLLKSIALAKTFQDADSESRGYSWLSLREELSGDTESAISCLKKSESLLHAESRTVTRTVCYFFKGYFYYHRENMGDAKKYIRRAILQSLQDSEETFQIQPLMYTQLSWVYLRERDYSRAKFNFKRTLEFSERLGWVRGIAMAHLGLGVIAQIQKKESLSLKKARRLLTTASGIAVDTRVEQLEFMLHVFDKNFEIAKDWALKRIATSEASPSRKAHAILDVLFLSRLCSGIFEVSPSWAEEARTILTEGRLLKALASLEYLLNTDTISAEDFLEKYIF